MSNAIERWEPFKEMMSLREAMNRLVEDSFIRPGAWPVFFDSEAMNVAMDVSRRPCPASSPRTSTCP